jgi:hypothetical protein
MASRRGEFERRVFGNFLHMMTGIGRYKTGMFGFVCSQMQL